MTQAQNQLRAARVMANLSQRELAKRAGLSIAAYANIETGRSVPRLDTWRRIVAALESSGISLSDDGLSVSRAST